MGIFRPLKGRDLALHAAAITFYGGIAVVPVALLAIWAASILAGADGMRALANPAIDALPDRIGADRAAAGLLEAGLGLTPGLALAALLPATFYGEGLRRAFVSVAGPRESLAGWRGRVLLLPILVASPGLLAAALACVPFAARLFDQGGWARFGGIVVSFTAVWLVLTPVLIWVYHGLAPGRAPGWVRTVLVGSFTAANLSGFLHGFILFCALPLDLGLPFGGLDMVGGVVAVGLWLYLFHVIVLAGFAASRAGSRHATPDPATASEPDQATEPAQTAEPAAAAEPDQPTEPAKAAEPAEAAEPPQATEPARTAEPAEAAEPGQAAEPAAGPAIPAGPTVTPQATGPENTAARRPPAATAPRS
ncbi:membrane protein [Catenuloplanes nepalensis]|uniref:Membrane protein n=1 Tax=Catenuloplanes nepalensis TaxID=587533 RepID=A0ABT9N099_9ACTN|nr:YhjD/YihY/BrkB family envelope integrity protein [Catenuloplanes nepalensis]MDP9797122.1 membrane protein [Catenuloplanes nepalensis]